jgi:hypothetical protein
MTAMIATAWGEFLGHGTVRGHKHGLMNTLKCRHQNRQMDDHSINDVGLLDNVLF